MTFTVENIKKYCHSLSNQKSSNNVSTADLIKWENIFMKTFPLNSFPNWEKKLGKIVVKNSGRKEMNECLRYFSFE